MWLAILSCSCLSRTSRRSRRFDDCSVKMRAAFFDSSVDGKVVRLVYLEFLWINLMYECYNSLYSLVHVCVFICNKV